jgi:hypothetical protein
LTFAAEAVTRARKDFELLARLDGQTARCLESEEAWRGLVKDCLRGCIQASISVSVVRKAVERVDRDDQGGEMGIKVEVPRAGEGYHDWWVVPKVVVVK